MEGWRLEGGYLCSFTQWQLTAVCLWSDNDSSLVVVTKWQQSSCCHTVAAVWLLSDSDSSLVVVTQWQHSGFVSTVTAHISLVVVTQWQPTQSPNTNSQYSVPCKPVEQNFHCYSALCSEWLLSTESPSRSVTINLLQYRTAPHPPSPCQESSTYRQSLQLPSVLILLAY